MDKDFNKDVEVGIIMASYNGEQYIAEQIESILASDYKDFHLFIYDDGSTDRTPEILSGYQNKYKNKISIYMNVKNKGVTRNFLEAICNTEANYMMFCDQDDVWKKDKISQSLKYIKELEAKDKNAPVVVFTDTVVVDKELNTIHESFFKASHLNPYKNKIANLLMENKLIGCTIIINQEVRKVLMAKELPNHARFHDWWIGLVGASCGEIGFLNKSTLLYRQHGKNVVGNMKFSHYVLDRIRNIKKQKQALLELQNQAAEFCNLYKEDINAENYNIIYTFSQLSNYNFVKRKYLVVRNGYLKTGFLRNIALLLLI